MSRAVSSMSSSSSVAFEHDFAALAHLDVTGGAGAHAAARVVDVDVGPVGDVQDAKVLPDVPMRVRRRIHFDGLSLAGFLLDVR